MDNRSIFIFIAILLFFANLSSHFSTGSTVPAVQHNGILKV